MNHSVVAGVQAISRSRDGVGGHDILLDTH